MEHAALVSPLHLIANAASGRGEGAQLADLARVRCEAQGRSLKVYSTNETHPTLESVAQHALSHARRDGGVVAAAGGDGTIRTVAQVLAGTGVSMAVIPIGTFNFFARNFAIPEQAESALEVALGAHERAVSLGCINDEIFLINASIGLYAKAIQEREQRTSRFGRRRIVVIASTLLSILAGHRNLELRLTHDEGSEWVRTPTVFIGNNALQLRNLALDVAECAAQGQLAVVMMRPVGTWGLLRLALRGLMRALQQDEALQMFCSESLEIRRPRARSFTVALDGELLRLYSPLKIAVLPAALRLRVPAPSAA